VAADTRKLSVYIRVSWPSSFVKKRLAYTPAGGKNQRTAASKNPAQGLILFTISQSLIKYKDFEKFFENYGKNSRKYSQGTLYSIDLSLSGKELANSLPEAVPKLKFCNSHT
jgi:hypothetical protein